MKANKISGKNLRNLWNLRIHFRSQEPDVPVKKWLER
jgi:hypothetical protein